MKLLALALSATIVFAAGLASTMEGHGPDHGARAAAAPTPVVATPRDCMALAAFTEARSEGAAGMAAVLEVVRNRMEARQIPACDVVTAPGQFLGVTGWSSARAKARNAEVWEVALQLADLALAGADLVPPRCRGATNFNQARNTRGLTPLCRIGAHQFYEEKSP